MDNRYYVVNVDNRSTVKKLFWPESKFDIIHWLHNILI